MTGSDTGVLGVITQAVSLKESLSEVQTNIDDCLREMQVPAFPACCLTPEQDALSLLAYENPQSSPQANLFSPQRRLALFKVVNIALLGQYFAALDLLMS